LTELESGGIFRNLLNITNFIEGDYFSWYLEELDKELADALCDVAKKLSDYEPATPVLEPELTRDMLKRLYQNLVPRKIRHDLGEYYTPDWLAELVLDEVGLTLENFEKLAKERGDNLAPLSLRILDPACGSGTFLVLAIKRLKEYAEEHYLRDITPNYIFKNVVGFDLNPLAVLAARTNYLLVMADMLSYAKGPVEIPVYLADSLLVEAKSTLKGEMYVIRTYVEEFELPRSIVERGLLNKLLGAIDRYVRLKYKPEEFKQIAEREIGLSGEELDDVKELYGKFLRLEEEKKNHVWVSVIRNAFAPLVLTSQEKFDYVIGNPPWINWENLPEFYRDSTKQLWDDYGLLKRTKGAALGKVKKDIAMLFAARCLDRFTKDCGRLSFLVPFTVYKTQAGAGFREFLASGTMRGKIRCPCKVLKIHDLVTLYPFEGAVNRTSLVVIEKSEGTKFPVDCVIWHNPRSGGINQEDELEEVKRTTKQFNMKFLPIERDKPGSPWMQITDKAYEGIKKVIGSSPWYRAHAGVYTGLNQVYWIKIISELPDGLLITNPPLPGQKKTVKQVEQIVEKELVYPLIRGRDVKRWYATQELGYILLPVDEKGETLTHEDMKLNYPKTWSYLINFVQDLVRRGGEPYKSKLAPYREEKFEKAEKIAPPFYWLFNASPSLAPYKVVWKYIAGKISGKAEFSTAVLSPIKTGHLGIKTVIPNEKLMLIPFKDSEEAYYVCGILNSSIVQLIVSSYVIETAISTHIAKVIKIPKFDQSNSLHGRLSQLSYKAHEIAKKIYEENKEDLKEDLSKIEEEIDKAVAQLYGITDEELDEIRKCLAILKEGEIPEEEEEITEEPEEIKVDFLNTVVKPNTVGVVEISVINPLKDKLIIEVGPPSIPAKLETSKEEDKFHIKIQPLEAGEYEVPYKVITSKGVVEGKFTLYVKEEERRRTRDLLSSKIDELLGEET
jgi:methylase of polypeptide subunit release factors/methionine-rich copper-binding protein CopC